MITPLVQLTFVCIYTLAFTFACISEAPRIESPAPTPLVSTETFTSEEQGDEALAALRNMDRAARGPHGQLAQMSAAEHLRRAATYMTNRAFAEAREHWQALITRYPNDVNIPAALFGMGRSYYQERRYAEALPIFERLGREYAQTKEGRDGFYFVAPTLLRMDRAAEAAARYREYTEKFPHGERIEDAYLNVIDTLREAGQREEAISWITRTRERFAGMPASTSALFARLRLDVAAGDWSTAIQTSDELRGANLRGVNTTPSEIAYLRAYSLEQAKRTAEAIKAYQAIPDGASSYYGNLATTRLLALGGAAKSLAAGRTSRARGEIASAASAYPAPYREIILRAVAGRSVDPRLILALMRQESSFNPRARSRAAARGLMQLTIDTAHKYAPQVQLNNLREDDLYRPEVSITVAAEYLAELTRLFPDLPEAVAASYNGGEDNVVRWLQRARQKDPGVFTSEVGYTETKDYVAKVMANYRAYRQLYTADLRRT